MMQPSRWRDHQPPRLLAKLLLALVALLGVMALAQPASAQDEVTIQVQVKDQQRDAGGSADNQPVPGVTVTVLDEGGNEIGTAVTDDRGIAAIPVPGRANYTVRLDEGTLPDDLELAERVAGRAGDRRRLVRHRAEGSSTSSPARARVPQQSTRTSATPSASPTASGSAW